MEAMGFGLFVFVGSLFLGLFVFPVLMAFFYYHGLRDEKEKKGVLSKQQKWSIVRQSFLTSFLILIILIVLLVVYSYFGLGGQEELVVSILA